VKVEDWGGTQFRWRRDDAPERTGFTVWSLFKEDSTYFDPGTKPFMINYIVEDLASVRAQLPMPSLTSRTSDSS